MTIFRASERKQLQQGLNAVVGLEMTNIRPSWRDIFTEEGSEKAYEEDQFMVGTGAAAVKGEGAGVAYDDMFETYTSRYQHSTIAMAVAITEEAVEDNLYLSMGSEIARAMTKSMQYTKEVRRGNILNFAFDSTHPGGDGTQLINTAHPLGGGGTLSNTLTTAAQLSESSMEELSINVSKWTDDRGIPMAVDIKKLVIPPDLQYVAARLLMTPYQPDTNDNNINALFKLGTIEDGFSVNRYLTDPAKWFLITDVRNGLKAFNRVSMKKTMEGEFESGNLRYKLRERYSEGWTNFRGIAGS